MSEPATHTPLPWHADEPGDGGDIVIRPVGYDTIIAEVLAEDTFADETAANAALIVTSVNGLQGLLCECVALLPVLRAQPTPKLGMWNWPLLADRLEAAIAAAKGQPSTPHAEAR